MPRHRKRRDLLLDIDDRLAALEQQAEVMKTVLIVKEPGSVQAADAYDGLRKQIVASNTSRRTHMAQLAAFAVAVSRATEVDDLVPQVEEWLGQAGIARLSEVPEGTRPQDLFDDIDGGTLQGATELTVVEPAFVDTHTQVVIRLGRARRRDLGTPTIEAAVGDEERDR